ncbi:phage portal protein [Gimesia maris]|uniref:phage portal protein n=1 Tax=Gimesia maris TaxID=122 RepID=UPI0032EE7B97
MLNVVDKVIGYFNPGKALSRMQDRHAFNSAVANQDVIERAYAAARVDRLSKNWRTSNRSADLELQDDADTIRARARDLVRNNAYARGIIRAKVRNIVGSGIKPQARVKKQNGEQNETFNELIEEVWDRFQRGADITGRQSFYEMQQTIISEVAEAGEILVQFVEVNDPARQIPFALELIDIDRLSDDELQINQENGNEIRRGVEIDSSGRTVAYWLYPYHPNDISSTRVTAVRRSAENFIHLFRPNRVGQTRGVSDFAPIVMWLKNLDKYMDNELKSSTVASCFSVAIKTIGAGSDGGITGSSSDDGKDANENPFEYLEPALVARLFPGEEIQTIDPSRHQSEAIAWLTLMQRAMGVGTGLSYERLTRDYSQTNYSSNRASDLEDRREFRMEQQWLIDHFCIPVWERFISLAVSNELEGMPEPFDFIANFHTWVAHEWQPPGWEWVDPLKEVTAIEKAVNMHLSTLAKETLKRDGSDWRSNIKQRGIEKTLIEKEIGIEDVDGEANQKNTEVKEPVAA